MVSQLRALRRSRRRLAWLWNYLGEGTLGRQHWKCVLAGRVQQAFRPIPRLPPSQAPFKPKEEGFERTRWTTDENSKLHQVIIHTTLARGAEMINKGPRDNDLSQSCTGKQS
ncbi:MAG: hypothetical protein CL912_30320 [Deltaproteobacteria bacterium]|nr:hypothetical protein [Deltaproteobacteria bacterium]